MSWTGQSDANHSSAVAPAKEHHCRRLTGLVPAGTTFGPITVAAYTYSPARLATSSQTSGWACQRHTSDVGTRPTARSTDMGTYRLKMRNVNSAIRYTPVARNSPA